MEQMNYEAHRASITSATQQELLSFAMQLLEKLKSADRDNVEARRELGDRVRHLHRRNIALERTIEQLREDLLRAKQKLMQVRNG